MPFSVSRETPPLSTVKLDYYGNGWVSAESWMERRLDVADSREAENSEKAALSLKQDKTHLGPSKSIITPAWYHVTLLGGISCASTIHVRLIVLPLFTYTSSWPVIFACTSISAQAKRNELPTTDNENSRLRLCARVTQLHTLQFNYFSLQVG